MSDPQAFLVFLPLQDDLSVPVTEVDLDGSSGVLFPFYDADTNMLYVVGRSVWHRREALPGPTGLGPLECKAGAGPGKSGWVLYPCGEPPVLSHLPGSTGTPGARALAGRPELVDAPASSGSR